MARRQKRIVLLLWGVAFLFIAAFFALGHYLKTANIAQVRSGDAEFTVADEWRIVLNLLPLPFAYVALVLGCLWTRGYARVVTIGGMVCMLPITFIFLLVAGMGAYRLDEVRLASGRLLILACEGFMTDAVYTLYEETGPFGFWWLKLDHSLDYSEDGRFINDERLVRSPDNRWLLVARAGLWTDCFHLRTGDKLSSCSLKTAPAWFKADYEADMHKRSLEIRQLTGLIPPPRSR